MENNKNKKSVNFQGDMLNFCDFIQVFVFTTNHHLECCVLNSVEYSRGSSTSVPNKRFYCHSRDFKSLIVYQNINIYTLCLPGNGRFGCV